MRKAPPEESFRLGPFLMRRTLGRGGMAEVWLAEHARSGEAVAVKLVARERARTRNLRAALLNEVRAMAGIGHPGVVEVLDYGEVNKEEAEASAGHLEAGSPYLVMELVEGGSLRPMASYAELKALLLGLLGALGHAHARGVIHRDIKPTNILLAHADGPPSPKLTDFGIAFALHAEGEDAHVGAGTPRYMAPEQILGSLREQGPWTDLYSLGCVAYLLACNRPPYADQVGQAIYLAQCHAPPPLFLPAYPVPEGFEAWLLRTLAKAPSERFRTAADAAHALCSLRGALRGPWREPALGPAPAPADPIAAADQETVITGPPAAASAAPPDDPDRAAARRPREAPAASALPPIPPSWRASVADRGKGREPKRGERRGGLGLGLWGLRTIPLVGREAERDALWESLREVHLERRPRAVVLRGPAGVGKSRLVSWLAERALEAGAAEVLRAEHAEVGSARHGLRGMMLRHLRAQGLGPEALRERLRALYAELSEKAREREVRDLAMLLSPVEMSTTRRFARPEELYAVHRRVLRHLGRERPLILLLDDLHWGRATLGLVEHLLGAKGHSAPPTLLLLVATEEELARRPSEAAVLARIAAHPRSRALPISALPPNDHRELVRSMLSLDPAAASSVVARTEGHPAFAVQLVGDWVQRGLLIQREGRFSLAEGEGEELPEDLRSLFVARIERLLRSVRGADPEVLRAALEIGACLGREVEGREWLLSCRAAGLSVPESLLDAMALFGLVETDGEGGRFTHAMLRECLLAGAEQRGRLGRWHSLCADSLARLHEPTEVCARRALHLHAAGRWAEALEAIEVYIDQRIQLGKTPELVRLMEIREEVLRALGAGPSDPRVRLGQLRWVEISLRRGDLSEPERLFAEIEASAPADQADPLLAHRAWMRGVLAHRKGELVRGKEAFEEALAALGEGARSRLAARCYNGLAECEKRMGQLGLARGHYREAESLFAALGADFDHGRVLSDLADALRREGRLRGAITLLERSRELLEPVADRYTLGILANVMGDIERKRGHLDVAERLYGEALAELEELGLPEAGIVRLNLCLVLVDREQHEEASRLLAQVALELEREGRSGYLPFAHAVRLPCAASLGQRELFDSQIEQLEAALAVHKTADEEIARYVERAAEAWERSREPGRARRAYALAQSQWRTLGERERAEFCSKKTGKFE